MTTSKETLTYCLKDSRHNHYWTTIGVIQIQNGTIAEVWKCYQCHKFKLEFLEQITRCF